MDPMSDEHLDYEDEEYGAGQKLQFHGVGAISALAKEDLMGDDDEYVDLYIDVNVGEGFMQSLQQKSEPAVQFGNVGNGGEGQRTIDPGSRVAEPAGVQEVTIPGIRVEGTTGKDLSVVRYSDPEQKKSGVLSGKNLEEGGGDYPDMAVSQNQGSGGVLKLRVSGMAAQTHVGGGLGYRVPVPYTKSPGLGSGVEVDPGQVSNKLVKVGSMSMPDPGSSGICGAAPTAINRMGANRPLMNETSARPVLDNGNTMLFVGELHWWTTDAELESVLSQYGRVKELKFFYERSSGKSKGYCQVVFYEASAAAACKEGMNGHVFNGQACVVAFASLMYIFNFACFFEKR